MESQTIAASLLLGDNPPADGSAAVAPSAAAAFTQLHGNWTSGAARICETAEGFTMDVDDKAAD